MNLDSVVVFTVPAPLMGAFGVSKDSNAHKELLQPQCQVTNPMITNI
jgi:hypothetical protein